MSRGLKLVVLAAYLTSVYGAALPKEGGQMTQSSTKETGYGNPTSTKETGHGHPTGTTKHHETGTKTRAHAPTGTSTGAPGQGVHGPVIEKTFPNPCLIQVKDTWYSFATSHNGKHIQMAKSTDFENWTYLDKDAMPDISKGKWIAQKGDMPGSGSGSHTGTATATETATGTKKATGTKSKKSPEPTSTGKPTNDKREEGPATHTKSESSLLSTKKGGSTETQETHKPTHKPTGKPTGTGTRSSKGSRPTGGAGNDSMVKIRKPDVIQAPGGKFVMQFTSRHEDSVRRCIGVATAENIEGPYVPNAEPLHCEDDLDGSDFDSAFFQEDSKLYMVYNRRAQQQGHSSSAAHSPLATETMTTKGGAEPTGTNTLDRRAKTDSPSPTGEGGSTRETGTATRVKSQKHTGTKTGGTHPTGKPTGTHAGKPPGATGQYRPSELSLMELNAEGDEWYTKAATGKATTLLSSEQKDVTGVSAPYLVKVKDVYFLTFSTGAYNTSAYDIQYATSSSLQTPFKRAAVPLLEAADYPKLNGPGAASLSRDGSKIVFENREPKMGPGSGKPVHHGGAGPATTLKTHVGTPVPTHTGAPNNGGGKKQQNERRAGNSADGANNTPLDIAENAGLLPPTGSEDQMSRQLWVGSLEYAGNTMKIAGSKKSGGSSETGSETRPATRTPAGTATRPHHTATGTGTTSARGGEKTAHADV